MLFIDIQNNNLNTFNQGRTMEETIIDLVKPPTGSIQEATNGH